MAAKLEMVRGDYREMHPLVPLDSYQAGGELFFTVKATLDNATDDSSAVFTVDMTDSDIVDMSYVRPASTKDTRVYVKYLCVITSDSTNTYQMDAKKVTLIGELQYVAPGVKPLTWPQFDFILYKDATRRRT